MSKVENNKNKQITPGTRVPCTERARKVRKAITGVSREATLPDK
jgi:hypothetical protein